MDRLQVVDRRGCCQAVGLRRRRVVVVLGGCWLDEGCRRDRLSDVASGLSHDESTAERVETAVLIDLLLLSDKLVKRRLVALADRLDWSESRLWPSLLRR